MRRRVLLACLAAAVLGALVTAGDVVWCFRGWDRGKLADKYLAEARKYAARGRHQEARRAVELALAINPENPAPHRELAMHLEAEGRWQEAISQLRVVAEMKPWDPGAAWDLAIALRKAGDAQAAAYWFRQVADAMRRNALARALEAEQLLVLGDAESALPEAEEGARRAPWSPQVQHVLGLAQWKSGNLVEARATLEMAWQLRPADPGPLLSLVSLAKAAGQPQEAVRYLQRAAQVSPRDPLVWAELADALMRLGRRAEAEQVVARLRLLRPKDPSARRAIDSMLGAARPLATSDLAR